MSRVSARTRHITAAIVVPVLLFVTLVCWAFASPVGSSPDDNFHLPSIWCGAGDRAGLCEASGDPDTRLVPAPVINAPCFAFRPDQSAACWNPVQPELAEATWMNANGLYPPLFYATMSVFVSDDVAASVIVMRVFNSALVVGLLSAVFFALPRRARPALAVSVLASAVPLGLFIVPSTNPSSWAFASAAVVWIALYGALLTQGRRQITLGALAILGAILGAGARADAAVFAVFGVILAAVLGVRRDRKLLIPSIAAILITIISLAFFFSASQGDAISSGLPTDNPPLSVSQHLSNLVEVPALWLGAFGATGLGWLDTVLPAVVTALAFGVFCASVFIGLHRLAPRRAIAVALAFAALWLVPFVLLAQSRAVVGEIVQSRYLLPLVVILLGVASAGQRMISAWSGPRAFVAGVALTAAMSFALHDNIRRYTFGADGNAVDPGAGAEWWWAAAPSPLTIWIVGTLAFAAILAVLWLELRDLTGSGATQASVQLYAPPDKAPAS